MFLMLVFASGCVSVQAPGEDGKAEGLVLYQDWDEELAAGGSGLKEIPFDGEERTELPSEADGPTEEEAEAAAEEEPGQEKDGITGGEGSTEKKAGPEESAAEAGRTEAVPDENGIYTSKEDVALYIHTYGRLPDNFITKNEAKNLGWSGGSLEDHAPGKCIGGSRYGNYEGLLPYKKGRVYYECDIDTLGAAKRGAKRIVYSNDGLVYYTEDHYNTFEQLY